MKDSEVGYSKLLVARGNERSRVICRRMQFMSANEEQDRGSSREVEVEKSPRKAVDTYFSGLYHEVTNSSGKGCNLSSLQ